MAEKKLLANREELDKVMAWNDEELPELLKTKNIFLIFFIGGVIFLLLSVLSSSLFFDLPPKVRNHVYIVNVIMGPRNSLFASLGLHSLEIETEMLIPR